MLAALGMIWAAFLLPRERGKATRRTVEDFERNMELLAETGASGRGRWIVTPQKGVAFMGPRARALRRARDRRRRVFVILLESIALSLLIGLVPPLRPMWYLTAVLLCLLALYVWLLLWLKERGPQARSLEQARLVRVPGSARVAALPKYVADPSSRTPRPTYNGLTVDGDDAVSIVVRPADEMQPARA
jgi:Flp pilus assembly protein TadB